MRYYLIAGERSGDLHGGNLIASLKQYDSDAVFRGLGGDYMSDEGMELVTHYRQLAFMGFAEVIANLKTIARKLKETKTDILNWKPDVVVLIDYPGFNLRIAHFAKQNGIRVFWYISPKVWAWNQRRALKLKACVDRMFVILPFEKEFFKKYNWDVDYVGNPVLDAVREFQADSDPRPSPGEKKTIAILPGSRKQELVRMLPVLNHVCKKFPEWKFIVSKVSNLDPALYDQISGPNVVLAKDEAYAILQRVDAAIVTSGTATLETACFRVPQVVVYKTSALSYAIGKRLVKVKFISLVNLIVNEEVVRELIQSEANPDAIANELQRLVVDEQYRKKIQDNYARLLKLLETPSASATAAKLMVEDLIKSVYA